MENVLHNSLNIILHSALWMVGFGVCFALLSRLWPCNPGQRAWGERREIWVDACYWLLLAPPLAFLRQAFIIVMALLLFGHHGQAWMNDFFAQGYGVVGASPLWAQMALVLLVQDVYLYWMHRLLHGNRLWRFHAIHHAPKQLDWTATRRFHPVNSVLSFVMADALVLLMGASPEAILWLVPFNAIYSAMVHANLNWTFGPFRYVLASPVFHRWHHTGVRQGGMSNFAPTFPVLDILFGTFYMPKGELPQGYGVSDRQFPKGVWGQMIYPFKRK